MKREQTGCWLRGWRGELAFFLGLAALFYSPLLLTLCTFPDGDFTHHFLPFALFQRHELINGQLPLWNPYTYSGHPFLADTQAAVFYPLGNLLLLLTLPWANAADRLYFLQVEAILHVALAGWLMTQLLKTWTGSRWAGILAGVTFAFSGYLTGYPALQLAILRSAIWLPLLLLCLYHAFRSGRWHWWIGAALVYATAFLAGHPQTFLHITYVVVPYCLLCLVVPMVAAPYPQTQTRIPHSALRTLLSLLTFFILTLLLSAAQLLPSLEFTQLSVRVNTDYAFVSGGFPVQDTWQIFFPGILTQFSPLYIGVVGIGLALIAIGHGTTAFWKSKQPFASFRVHCCFFTIITFAALFLSYGDHSFLYPLFYRFAPGWQLFRGQERTAFLVTFGLSALTGFGAALLPQLAYGWRRRVALWILCLFSACVFAFGLFWQIEQKSAVSNVQYLIVAALTTMAAAILLLILWLPGWGRRQQWLVLGLAVLTLFVANFSTNLTQFAPTRKVILAPEMEALGKAVAEQTLANLGLPGRVYNEFRIYEDYGMRQQIEDVWGSSPLRVARYAQLVDPAAQFPLARMWRLLGVNHLLTWRRELFVPSQVLSEFPQVNDTTFLHRLNQANPRAWIVGRTEIVGDEQSVKRLADHNFDLGNTGLLPSENTLSALELIPGNSMIQLQRPASNRLHIHVESENGGLLIISETWMPGWQVRNVQKSTPESACSTVSPFSADEAFSVQRVNLTLIGLPLPPCAWEFNLIYWPDSVRYGLWISGVTGLALLVIGTFRKFFTSKAIFGERPVRLGQPSTISRIDRREM